MLTNNNDTLLNLLVKKGTSEDLALVFSALELADLNALLTNTTNKVLDSLRKSPEHLAKVLFNLEPADLNVLLNNNKIVNSDHLAGALKYLDPKGLNVMLTDSKNGVLEYLVKATRKK